MTLLHPKVHPAEVNEHDPEALIREARRLRRRRWMLACLVVALVVGAVVAGLVASGGSGRPVRTATLTFSSGGPTVDAKAFAGEGDLAFVSRDTVYVLDGASNTLRHLVLPRGFVPGAPSFSHDGRWLAVPASEGVTASNGDYSSESTLWLASANGSHLHEVAGFDNPEFLGWSPTTDVLAVTNQGEVPTTYQPVEQPTSLWLVYPNGMRRELVRPGSGMIDGATWSPNGSEVAVGALSTYPFQEVPVNETLTAYPVDGAKPTRWLRIHNPRSNGCCDTAGLKQSQFIPVGWWPRWGIVFWGASEDVGSGLNGGSFPLFAIPAPGDKPTLLGSTAAGGQVSTIVAAGSGELAISNNQPRVGTRPFWQSEQVLSCNPATLSCAPVPSAVGTVSFDPAWSPDGSQLAYLVGKALTTEGYSGFTQKSVSSWYDSLQLWLYSPRTGRSTQLSAAKGAVVPIWSADSKSLLYVDHDGLWLLKSPNAQPVEIAGPLLRPNDWNAYFAQLDWAGWFAWSHSQHLPQPNVLTPM